MTDAGAPHGPDAMREDALSAYLDGELDADERAAVDARLAGSPEWRAVLDELRETRDALRALPAVDGAPEFWARVLDPVAARDAGAGSAAVVDLDAERRSRRRGWRVAGASVAASIAIIAVGVALVPQRERVKPAVATFTEAHATRSSLEDDPLSNLASVGIPGFSR